MVYIVVEGQTDKALIKNILSDKTEDIDFKFSGLKGIDSVKETLKKLNKHDLSQNKYFAIVDADASFEIRNTEMTKLRQNDSIDFYIFPNNKDNGDLETLLLSHVNEDNKIIKCFDDYKACVIDAVKKDIDNKAKLYAYTTLEHGKKPEQYIKDLAIDTKFDSLKKELKKLFKEQN
jgi:hypothetical protein